MPFAPKIRKDVLRILADHILPTLQAQEIQQILAEEPFDFPGIKQWTLLPELLPDNDKGPLQVIREWPEHGMVSSRGLNISFLYEGSMHAKVGILESHGESMRRKGLTPPPGVRILELHAPSILLYSDFVAREDGELFDESRGDRSRTMSLKIERNNTCVFHSARNRGQRTGTHHLEIHDSSILQLGALYRDELRLNKNLACAQTLLLALMFRLQYNLQYKKPGISNSCWLDPLGEPGQPLSPIELKHQALAKEVADYIQTHLQDDLSLAVLAAHFSVSEFHLNKVFRKIYGTTVMRYVMDLRVSVAKRILLNKKLERINDIAMLTGFASGNSFSIVFRNQTGFTPRQYRRQFYSND